MKRLFIFLVLLVFGAFVVQSMPAQAQITGNDPLGLEYGELTDLAGTDPRISAARIIQSVLGLLGIVAVVLILYAGFRWMTAGGNEDNVKTARAILMYAVIGLAIILSAYSITRFVLSELYQATQGIPYDTPL